MAKRETLTRHHLIIRKLRQNPATFEEIVSYLRQESELQGYDFVISKRTFQRDIADIRSVFDIDIQYDFSEKAYYIAFNGSEESHERIFEAYDVFNALRVNERLSKYIHFEDRKPKGTEHLYGLLHAIKNNLEIKFTYQKFWKDKLSQRYTEPYALKEFKNRWYVIAKDKKDEAIKIFALDRLSNPEITSQKFRYPRGFNVEEYFRYCFGIVSPIGQEPQDIILSFTPFQGKYIKTLPLHTTQKILIDDEKETRIQLKLCLTHDLLMELLSFGNELKVMEPQTLVNQIKDAHEKAAQRY